jgi:S-adenosylmethionine:tRNA ribosyltransferase-isomerase
VHVSDFDFELPPELIAQYPAADPGEGRLLHLGLTPGSPLLQHTRISALPLLLEPGDLLVVNDTRVFPARLFGHRVPSGGAVECLLVSRAEAELPGAELWHALMHPGQKLKPGARLIFEGSPAIHAEVLERHFYGRRLIRLWTSDGSPVADAIDRIGHVPLPPYIKRPDETSDRSRYQTMFATRRGSVAAPTAGLHFNRTLTDALSARGVQMAAITLHVGYGTFQPVRTSAVEEHRLEAERYEIGETSARAVNTALDDGRRVIAVGTTTTRTLEAVAARHDGRVAAEIGETSLFIYPGFRFRVIRGLLTNFHLPLSSLLMLVCAFGGRERVLDAYRTAVAERYRFYSYGDAMLLL